MLEKKDRDISRHSILGEHKCGHNDQEFHYELLSQSLIFKEDDRNEKPFIVLQYNQNKISNLWFAVINLEENKFIDAKLINVCAS